MKVTFILSGDDGELVTLETPDFQTWNIPLYYFQQFLVGSGFVISPERHFELVHGDITENLTWKPYVDE